MPNGRTSLFHAAKGDLARLIAELHDDAPLGLASYWIVFPQPDEPP